MKRRLLIFGANGALGKGVTKALLKKKYDEIYLFDSKFNSTINNSKIKQVIVKDLSVETNVEEAFETIKATKKSNLFLFSTIGGYSGGKTIW
jgi:FlaA1/EpsC-like NDP-sugar epimerase